MEIGGRKVDGREMEGWERDNRNTDAKWQRTVTYITR